MVNFQETRFAISAAKFTDCPTDSLSEVAFAGRSNAGKSSAINTLTDQSNLARISKTPGRTQLINFFTVEPGRYLVDLPGYGYAKVPLAVKNKWQFELEQYLRKRQSLVGLVLLSDVRHPLKDFDRMMIDWATQSNLPLLLLLTKSDKLKKGPAQNTLLAAKKELGELPDVNVQLFSSLKKTGIKPVLSTLSDWLSPTESKI
ncbi:MAG: YihA family ribosome biogenesis GTP-binding protein [Gammaproteobacteria bacterium]|nr:YihA family ribosome biogenesis GTP-binding protein [Gammaproteobacteria bacterium]